MNGIFAGSIQDYVDRFTPQRDNALKEMESYASKHDVPIVGPHVGALLYILAVKSGAKRILELGAAIGYSGTWLARALPPDGILVTIEWSEETAELARDNFSKAGVMDRVELKVGSARKILPKLEGTFDIIFNDIDKEGYVDVLPQCVSHLNKGGLLITDNILWEGDVARVQPDRADLETATIQEYTKSICTHKELWTVIVPIRDGISISIKV